jgi:hypothetical protein
MQNKAEFSVAERGKGISPEDMLSSKDRADAAAQVATPAAVPETVITVPSVEKPKPIDGQARQLTPVSTTRICPNCKVDIDNFTSANPSVEDKRRWLRHIMGESRFCKEYSMYGGAAVIMLQSRTVKDGDEIVRKLSKLRDDAAFEPASIFEAMGRMRLAYSLKSITYSDRKDAYDVTAEGFDAVQARLLALPEAILEMLLHCQSTFDDLTAELSVKGIDTNFWKPIGPLI